ncbi:protein kinase [Streptomyces roseoverticillatus]|uniref:serine/threonine-protein kinase n=1 Tax=Streptomyces roseoverticillatus TaxID=66429 RepID=UPI0033E06E29
MRPLRADDPSEVAGYRLLARIGEGGMGSVFLSRTRGNQPVALKVIRGEFADEEEYRLRFQQEVRAARQVRGYHVVPVVDHDATGERPWLASTYIPGLPLHTALETFGPLPVPVVLQLVGCVAEALRAVHAAGIIHRDLKPSNVLLGSEGPWVIDFGIARAADCTQLTRSGGVVGTPQYMSPEHVAGLPLTPASDMFSLGLLAAVAATGDHPFGEGQATTVAHRIGNAATRPPDLGRYPAELRPLLDRCLAPEPGDRPGPAELAALCEQACGRELRDFDGWIPAPLAAETARRDQAVRELPDAPVVPAQHTYGSSLGPDAPTHPPQSSGSSYRPAGTGPAFGSRLTTGPGAPSDGAPVGPSAARHRRKLLLAAVALAAVTGLGMALHEWPGGGDPEHRAQQPPATSRTPAATPPSQAVSQALPSAGAVPATAGAPAAPVFSARPLMLRPPSGNSLFADFDVPQTTTDNSRTAGVTELRYDNTEGAAADAYQSLHFITPMGVSSGTTYQECLAGAQTNVLPTDVSKKDLIDHTTLHEGMVLCTLTTEHNLAMLEIKKVTGQNDMPAFDTLLTLWRMRS